MLPLPDDEKVQGVKASRLGFDKKWKGDFEGASKGEMMATEGSAGARARTWRSSS